MSIARALARALVVPALAAGTVLAVPPAQAADLRFVPTPVKVVVNQDYETIDWELRGSDVTWVDSADVELEHVSTREVADSDFTSSGGTSGQLRIYDFDRMGRYLVKGEAYDSDYNTMSVASAEVVIKRAARSTLTATRSGTKVTLRAVSKKYLGSYPLWANNRGATVTFQRRTSTGWTSISRQTVPSSGVTTFSLSSRTSRTYRAVVSELATVWGRTSAAVSR